MRKNIDEAAYAKVYVEVMEANECGRCGAPRGEWCVTTTNGFPRKRYHQIRWDQLHLWEAE